MLHCRGVSLRDVDFPLTRDAIQEHVQGREVYHLTEALILRSDDDLAVVAVETEGAGLMRPVAGVEVVALPDEVARVEDDDVDVFNPSHMARVAGETGRVTCVRGRYGYWGVAEPVEPLSIAVADLVPPRPSRLLAMVRDLVDADPPEVPVRLVPALVDAEAEAADADGPLVHPCEGSVDGPLFLDRGPELEDPSEVTVVGCHLSERIFKGLYGEPPELINVCPRDRVKAPGLARCCLVEEVEVEDGVATVPWGADHGQVRDALRALTSKEKRDGGRGHDESDLEPG